MDIEQGIREAIVGTLGPRRSEMWLGTEARIDICNACVQIHAVNSFAADWVGKSYLSAIQTQCRPLLAKGQRIEIVSPESHENFKPRSTEMPHEKAAAKPRFDAELLTRKKRRVQETQRFSDGQGTLPTMQLSYSFLEDTTTVAGHVAGDKQVKKTNPATGKSHKNAKISKSVAASQSKPDESKINAPANPKQPLLKNQNRTKTASSCLRLTPQELNGRVIASGKNKLAEMTSTTSTSAAATPSRRNTQSGHRSVAAHVSAETAKPALKRDEANRNVVLVSDRADRRAKASQGNGVTWDSFVVGPSNRLAVRAAELAIHHTGQISPIYIFGPTSVGKTLLLEMIKSGARGNSQTKPLVMMTAEQFTSSFIDGLKQGMPLFRNKFRGISALLIDDIHFFAGKESTQTEFHRTLDQLKTQGVQIVLTGDRPLNRLADLLKPEIIARLEAGMTCEIKPADKEMLLAIFKQMAVSRNLAISDDVSKYVVSQLATHARQLAGAINRLHAAKLTTNRPVTLETADNILEDMIRNHRRCVKLKDIEKAVCETMQLNNQVLQSKSRTKQATQPRMLAMWLARKYTRSALSEIGKFFGNRSHSTVVSAQKKVDQWLKESPDFGLAESSLTVAEAIQKVERLLQT